MISDAYSHYSPDQIIEHTFVFVNVYIKRHPISRMPFYAWNVWVENPKPGKIMEKAEYTTSSLYNTTFQANILNISQIFSKYLLFRIRQLSSVYGIAFFGNMRFMSDATLIHGWPSM